MLAALLERCAARRAEHPAIVQGARRTSYGELALRVAALERSLAEAGLGEGDRVGLVLPNVPEFVVAFLALARRRAVAVPLNPALSPGEIARTLSRVGPAALLAGPAWCERLAPELPELMRVELPFDAPVPAGVDDTPRAGQPFDGDVLIQASSGSTGLAKWVCRTQRNLVAEADGFGERAEVGPSDVVLGLPPLFHSHGLCNGMLSSLRAGATLVLLDRPSGDDATPDPPFALRCGHVLELLERERVTLLPGVPFMFEALARTGRRAQPDLSSLRLVFSAGNFLPEPTWQAFRETFGIEIKQLYGCTEAGAVTLNLEPADKTDWRCVGPAIPGMEIRAGLEPSEIRIRSAALGRYLEGDGARDDDGWFATGDLGRQDERGRLWITGRTKLFIDSGGYKVDPLEVEAVLSTHPCVEEAAVVGVGDARRGEEIHAFVVLREAVPSSELVAHCRGQLAAFKVPRRISVRESLPRSALGKLLRGQLIGQARA